MSDSWDDRLARYLYNVETTHRVYDCPKHGQVWAYLGPEGDCARCVREAREGE